MQYTQFTLTQSQEVTQLFTQVFFDSEGKEEGKMIGQLVDDLISTTTPQDLLGYVCCSNNRVIACIFFTPLSLPSGTSTFILSPVAVATQEQGKGVGQKLIGYGLEQLKQRNVEIAVTYGDPSFYSKVGFAQISEDIIKAPLTLSYPHGWLAQSLVGGEIAAEVGDTKCVAALDHQKYW